MSDRAPEVRVVVLDGSGPAPDYYGQFLAHYREIGCDPVEAETCAALNAELHDALFELLISGDSV